MGVERVLLVVLKFDLQVEHPYKYIPPYVSAYKDRMAASSIAVFYFTIYKMFKDFSRGSTFKRHGHSPMTASIHLFVYYGSRRLVFLMFKDYTKVFPPFLILDTPKNFFQLLKH